MVLCSYNTQSLTTNIRVLVSIIALRFLYQIIFQHCTLPNADLAPLFLFLPWAFFLSCKVVLTCGSDGLQINIGSLYFTLSRNFGARKFLKYCFCINSAKKPASLNMRTVMLLKSCNCPGPFQSWWRIGFTTWLLEDIIWEMSLFNCHLKLYSIVEVLWCTVFLSF
jgi:hypothetical protein